MGWSLRRNLGGTPAGRTVSAHDAVGVFLPLTAVVFYLALSIFFVFDPLRHMGLRAGRPADTNEPI